MSADMGFDVQPLTGPVEEVPLVVPAPAPPKADPEPAPAPVSHPGKRTFDWGLAVLLIGCSLFAAAFALFILYPAMKTLLGT
jgi:hypothetical protein